MHWWAHANATHLPVALQCCRIHTTTVATMQSSKILMEDTPIVLMAKPRAYAEPGPNCIFLFISSCL